MARDGACGRHSLTMLRGESTVVAVTRIPRSMYHRLVPYDLRIRFWEARRKTPFDLDHIPRPGAPATERYAVRVIGKRALSRSRFAQTIVRREDPSAHEHAMTRVWVEFALGTNQRGVEAVRGVEQEIEIAGARMLDIGCAYGGTPIAFAEAGAEAYGVEIDPGLLELAKLNLADHPQARCTLSNGDILQPAVEQALGRFDIITCDNVIEHVERASALVETIARMLTARGVCQMGIPNAFSVSEVMRDGHYGLFGLTLLPRDRAIAYYQAAGNTDPYGVEEYCFTYAEYVALFERAGLSLELVNALAFDRGALDSLGRSGARMRGHFERQVAEGRIPAAFRDEIRERLDEYLARFAARFAAYKAERDPVKAEVLGSRLLTDYQQNQWVTRSRHSSAE